MRLDQLLGGVEVLGRRGDPVSTEVLAVTHDSRAVVPGALFCCLPGERDDGHDFAGAAVDAGAAALLCERPLDVAVTQVIVADARAAMAPIAAAFHGHPSRALAVAGVTGTNGKTTTTHLLAAALEAGGRATEVIGTLSGTRTTPESPELQHRLASARDGGKAAAAMEVSSHALVLHRVDATWFSVVVFTNLSQDHLDFHGDMESYFQAKATLFDPARAAVGVVNADDPYGRRLLDAARLPTRPFTMADAVGADLGPTGSSFRFEGEPVRLQLGGAFNVANALAAGTAARALDVAPDAIAEGLSSVVAVPGRYESVDAGQPFAVIVDYAHTPAGLEQLISSVRASIGDGRVIVVFGCGGDRDREKRPRMGEVATRLADRTVLTSDNPRREDPRAIIADVEAGVVHRDRLIVEPDRRSAIALALAEAGPGDAVVIAGKGHETTQVSGELVVPFDDRVVAREAIESQP
jgi:UDP-N-acetylmuramoyl-L-alanyl-D-glutamate--2,6-diaminopimelate ligase